MRLTLRLVLVALLLCAILSLLAPTDSNAQIPPTNTPRPTLEGLPATNTPRPTDTDVPTVTLTPSETPTATLTPTYTLTPTDTDTPTPTFTPTPIPIGPNTYPDNINPLTGQPYPDDAAKNRRNLIVKVSNYTWVVRPQAGLSDADIVWEYEVEGGVTRFAAIYRSHGATHVGSVRSGRLLDLELVPMYNALLAYSGSNDNIKDMILKGSCFNKTGSRVPCTGAATDNAAPKWFYQAITPQFGDNCPPFCRFPKPGLAFEHTLFANTYQIWDLADKRNVDQGYSAKGFAFTDLPDSGAKTAADIYITYYNKDQDERWQYNDTDHKYYRWNLGIPHVDANNGMQLTANNVVIIEANHKDRPDIYESETFKSPAVEIQLWGQGRAWLFRDGNWYQGTWVRSSRDKTGFFLYAADGKTPMHLKPGNTWIEVVRCCNMSGVKVNDTKVDTDATATFAVMTATARYPALSGDHLTQTAAVAAPTNVVSAATAGITLSPVPSTDATSDTGGIPPTPTPMSVGMR
jgi:hypothetical protein